VTRRAGAAVAGLSILDLVIAGVTDQINNTLAIVMLNVEYLDDMLDELNSVAAEPRVAADRVVSDVISGVLRIRDIVRDLGALIGEEDGDVGEITAILVRLTRNELSRSGPIDEDILRPAMVRAPRRVVAMLVAVALGEAARALTGASARVTVEVSAEAGETVVAVAAAVSAGAHGFDRTRGPWRAAEVLLDELGGRLEATCKPGGFHVRLALPSAAAEA
jgi:hypothetical protein